MVAIWKELITTKEYSNFNSLLIENPYLKSEWEKYLELVKARQNKELQKRAESLSSGKIGSVSAIPQISHLEEKFERLTDAYERMRDYLDSFYLGIVELLA